jgi:predicted amidohydrolase
VREPLVLAVAQPGCTPYDVAAMSLTGYELDAPTLVPDDGRLAPLVAACAATGTLALAGAPVAGATGPHIALLAVEAGGARVAYRKLWLGGREPERFVPGPGPVVLDVDGWRLGLAICKDTGVPQHAAGTAALGADAYVAGVLEHERDAAVPAERARRVAADHRVWVAVASFAGGTGGGFDRAAGGSGIWSPDGVELARAGAGVGAVLAVTLR